MEARKLSCLLIGLFWGVVECVFDHRVTPSCPPDQDVCKIRFTITKRETMMLLNRTTNVASPLAQINGTFYIRSSAAVTACDDVTPATAKELEHSNPGDGRYVNTYFIDNQFPGPSIVVHEGQQVQVRVTNKMSQEGVSIHWHGMDQRHTPWMDGVASITQCPINPQETFTYIFVASPVGTAWYHSHYGAQYADGLFGPLIVLPRPQDVLSAATLEDKSGQEKNIQGGARTERPDQDQDLPHFAEEFVLMVSDWFQEESSSLMNRQVETLMKFGEDYTDMDNCFVKTITEDGSEVGSIKFESGLFNGRGRYDATSKVPLERFVVERGRFYRFRVISTATVYPFRLSIDKHKLMIFATEGGPITPVEADYLFIHSGERYDFYIRADQSGDLFWFRGEAPEKYYQVALPLSAPGKQVTQPGMVAAVLQYQEDGREGASSAGMGPRGGAPSQKENGVGVSPKRGNQSGSTASTVTEAGSSGTAGAKDTSAPVRQDYPTTNPRKCTKARPCTAVNCPFQNYATSHISCVNVGDLSGYTSPEGAVKPGVKTPRQGATDVIQEKIINFHFAFGHGGKGAQRSSVNGHEFILPSSPPVVNPFAQWDYPCTGICDDQQCMCTYTEQLNLGSTVQLVLFNSLSDLPPTNSISTGVDAIGHPVHLHGHKFTVLKVGYPTYDNLTGIIEAVNPDLRCPTDRCERPEWADPSWAGGRVPGLNLDNPVVKDTVIVPAAGYVVVRFEADNPGWWLLHCHLLIHAADGMSMLLQEGHVADMPKIPPGLPWCGSWSPSQINRTVNQMRLRAASDQSQAGAVVAAIVLVVILVTVSGISIVIKCRKKEEKTIKGPSYGGLSSHTSSMSFDHSSSMSLDLSSSVTCPTATTRP